MFLVSKRDSETYQTTESISMHIRLEKDLIRCQENETLVSLKQGMSVDVDTRGTWNKIPKLDPKNL